MSITDFLNARIAEDEEQAEMCRKLGWFPGSKYEMHAVSHARVLAECATKRAIVELHAPVDYSGLGMKSPNACTLCGADRGMHDWEWMKDSFPCPTIRALAAVYADHPEHQDEWKVGA